MNAALISIATLLAAACGVLLLWWRTARAKRRAAQQARIACEERVNALERLARRNAAILQNAMDGFFVLGEDYGFREVNAAFCRMTGYSTVELLGMKMTDLEVAAPLQDVGRGAFWRTGLHHFATSHRHKDGHIIQLESCVIVLRDGESKILVGFTRDVTERWRAEQALLKSEAQYRNLVETSRDLIWTLDLEGRWNFVNNAAKAIYGYDPEEMLGRSVMEFVHPDWRERATRNLSELRAGRPRLRYETQHVHRDGRVVHLSLNVIPLRDDYGNVIGFTGTSADITYRKDAEKQISEAHARFQSLVERMPLGYIRWSTDWRVIEWNPAAGAMFGYSASDALHQTAAELIIPASERQKFEDMSAAVLRGESCSGRLLLNRRKDGEHIKCEWHATLLLDENGRTQGIATLVRDVSERERLEAQLRQSQKLESLGVLAGGVAHDFNNLLVGILGNASLAKEQTDPASPVQTLLDRVVNAGRRATDLTQRMLAYAGRAACDVQIMDLNGLVLEMAEFAAAAIPKSVALRTYTASDLPLIRADSSQIQQVIMNLLINAAEAIGESSGEVVISTRLEQITAKSPMDKYVDQPPSTGTYVCLEVRDTGKGMTPDVQSRIFDPFFTTKFAGRGLGLSAILGIVRAHQGGIRVASEVGRGTVFRVCLPAATGQASVHKTPVHTRGLPRGSTILVIDDEEDIRDVVESVLTRRGIRVLTAENGRRGLELFRAHTAEIDAVLLDMNMPGMNGEAVFDELLKIRPNVKVILSTGYSEQEAATHFADAPLAGFVHKPYTASSLVDKIGAAIAG